MATQGLLVDGGVIPLGRDDVVGADDSVRSQALGASDGYAAMPDSSGRRQLRSLIPSDEILDAKTAALIGLA